AGNALRVVFFSRGIAGAAMVEGTGFEPVYAKRSDLQSDGFNHSPTPPLNRRRAGSEAPKRLVGRFMVIPGESVNSPWGKPSRKYPAPALPGAKCPACWPAAKAIRLWP